MDVPSWESFKEQWVGGQEGDVYGTPAARRLRVDIRMVGLEAFLELQRSRLDTYQKQRTIRFSMRKQGYVAPKLGQVSKAREDRDDPVDVGGFE